MRPASEKILRDIGIGNINYGAPASTANVFAPGIPTGFLPPKGSVIIASGAVRPSITGGVVAWNFINDTQHQPIFFSSVVQSPDTPSRIRINYPAVTKVLTFCVCSDETFAGQLTGVGATVTLNWADIQPGATFATYKAAFQGDGTKWTVPAGFNTVFPDAAFSGSSILLTNPPPNLPAPFNNFNSYSALYNGPNSRFFQKRNSGLGPFSLAFDLLDNTGTPVVPTVNDWAFVDTGNVQNSQISAYDPNNGWWNSAFSNLWIFAAFIL